MRKKSLFGGIFIFAALCSFSLFSCKMMFGDPAVSISGTPKIGSTITASSSGYASWNTTDYGYTGYFWEASPNGSYNWSSGYVYGRFNGSDNDKYELNSSYMVGYYIRAYRYNSKDRIYSNVLGPIDPAN